MQDFFVGVDAGGSHTVAALARGEEVLHTIHAETANPNVVGLERAAQTIAEAIERVLDGATPAAIGVGVAGAGSEEVQDALRDAIAANFPGTPLALTSDARIALRAVIPEGDGIVLIAGTGSIAYAEIGERTLRAGGYGYLLGDEGSGFAIGAAALRDLADAGDRQLLTRIYQSRHPVGEIAGFARLVLRKADSGNQSALEIVSDAAEGLFNLVGRIAQACTAERGSKGQAIPLAFSGGLLRERNALTQMLEEKIGEATLDAEILSTRREPYFGALAQARRLAALK